MSPSKSYQRRVRKKKTNYTKLILILSLVAIISVIIVGYIVLGNNTEEKSTDGNENLSTKTTVRLETNRGDIVIELRDDMPITTSNFKKLIKEGVYDNTIFHRVIPDFMIQGGDPTGTGFGDPSIPNIDDEYSNNPENNKNLRGTIAMANTGAPNSGSSQFFINIVYNSHLDNHHPVFGDVIQGMEVVDEISLVNTDSKDKPLEPITITQASIID
jgi:peptidylprolyl isomerase